MMIRLLEIYRLLKNKNHQLELGCHRVVVYKYKEQIWYSNKCWKKRKTLFQHVVRAGRGLRQRLSRSLSNTQYLSNNSMRSHLRSKSQECPNTLGPGKNWAFQIKSMLAEWFHFSRRNQIRMVRIPGWKGTNTSTSDLKQKITLTAVRKTQLLMQIQAWGVA